MHTYIRTQDDDGVLYVVGHYITGTWQPLRIFATELDASIWASFLNGGGYPALLATAKPKVR